MFKKTIKYLLLAATLMLAPSAASAAASYPFIEPSIAAVEALGAACGTTAAGVWIPNVGHYAWNGSSTATADGVNILQCTGVANGRMIIDLGPLALASITAMQALPGPVNDTMVDLSGLQGGKFVFNTSSTCTVNTGTCFAATDGTAGKWERQYEGLLNALWFGADPTDVAVSAVAINACIIVGPCYVPSGTYDADATIVVENGKSLVLAANATLHRHSTGVTTPVLEVLYVSSSVSGGIVQDDASSPSGAVVLGDTSKTDTTNAWWWSLHNMTIYAQVNPGDIAVLIPSGQYTNSSIANYFGNVSNVNIHGGDVGLELADYSNSHNISKIEFWGQKTCALQLTGAYANNISQFFVHTGAASGLVGICLTAPTSPSTFYTARNQITDFGDESGGAADKAVSIDATAYDNTLIGMENVADYGTTGSGNLISLNGNIIQSNSVSSNQLSVGGASLLGSNILTANDQSDLCLFAASSSCSTAQSGSFLNSVKIFGGYGQTRFLQLQQTSGAAYLGASGGDLQIDSSPSNGNINLTTGTGLVLIPAIPTVAPATHCALWDNAGVVNITTCP